MHQAVWSYIENMIPFLIIALPIILLWRVFRIIYCANKNKKPMLKCVNFYRETAVLTFVLYLVGLASQTIIPKLVWSDGKFVLADTRNYTKFNFIPFKTIAECFERIINQTSAYYVVFLLGNILMFVPIGFFFVLLIKERKNSCSNAVLCTLLVSLTIEIIQISLNRMVDIDDVILNTLGGFVGAVLCKHTIKIFPRLADKFKK